MGGPNHIHMAGKCRMHGAHITQYLDVSKSVVLYGFFYIVLSSSIGGFRPISHRWWMISGSRFEPDALAQGGNLTNSLSLSDVTGQPL
jgi:hypothetical protein